MRRIAVVTGGTRGIGRACVEQLARNGYGVVFFCHERTEAAEALTARLRGEGLDVAWRQVDVADGAQVRAAFDELIRL